MIDYIWYLNKTLNNYISRKNGKIIWWVYKIKFEKDKTNGTLA